MSLINPLILYGLGLAAIPVLLHLLMRSKPKKLMFPALRLIQMRRKTNSQRMRLRHIWLLLLRILVIGLLVLAVARPSLPAANYTPNLRESLTIGLILLVAAAVYWGLLSIWRRKRLPQHQLLYRRTWLRGGTGLAAFLLMLLLFVWPYQRRIAAEITGPVHEVAENLPVAAVFLFDTSPSMDYRLESKTRLELAQQIAGEHLASLPQGSQVAIADSSSDLPIYFQADLTGAQARIQSVEVQPVAVPLNDRLRAAAHLLDEDRKRTLDGQQSIAADSRSDRYLREIYLFTDFAKSGWRTTGSRSFRQQVAELPWLEVYLIDVGAEQLTNVGITELLLSRQTVSAGRDLSIAAQLATVGGEPRERTLELLVNSGADATGRPVKHDEEPVQLKPNSESTTSFVLPQLTGNFRQGEVRLVSSDPFASDNVRTFTVAIERSLQILIVAESAEEAVYLRTALVGLGYESTLLRPSELSGKSLNEFDVVCLINVRRPSEGLWTELEGFVGAGGGLAVFLGMENERVNPVSVAYNSVIAQSLLPGELLADLRFEPAEFLDLRNQDHPVLSKLAELGGDRLLASVAVQRFWRVAPSDESNVIVHYSDSRQSAALLDRVYGKGRVMMLTTAIDLGHQNREAWNRLVSDGNWAFMAFAEQMMDFLSGRTANVYNYLAGEDPIVGLDPDQRPDQVLLRKPGGQQMRLDVPPDRTALVIADADQVGHYQILSADDDVEFSAAFSVNTNPRESDFTRIEAAELDDLIGQDRYSVARDIQGLTSSVSVGRIGIEAFPLVVLLMIGVFCTEHLVANYFYDTEDTEHRG